MTNKTSGIGNELWTLNEGRSTMGWDFDVEQSLCFGEDDKEYYDIPNSRNWWLGELKSCSWSSSYPDSEGF